jgi:hypothetical protein
VHVVAIALALSPIWPGCLPQAEYAVTTRRPWECGMGNQLAETYARNAVASAGAAQQAAQSQAMTWLAEAVINLGRAVQELARQQETPADPPRGT